MWGPKVLIVAAMLLAWPVVAAAENGFDDCAARDLDKRLAACTRIIDAGGDGKAARAAAYYNRGNAYREKGEYDLAIADYGQAIALDPRSTAVYHNRGVAFHEKGDNPRAVADFGRAIKLDPRHVRAYSNRGIAYGEMGRYRRAMADYGAAIRIDPTHAIAYYNRGMEYADRGDYDRAVADFSAVIRLAPEDSGGYQNRARAYRDKGDFERAIADYGEVIRLESQDADAYTERGNAYRDSGDYERALADYGEAMRLDPADVDSYKNAGLAHLAGGALAKAKTDLRRASELAPEDAYVALWLEIAERRDHGPSPLRQAAARLDMKAWPAPVIRLFLGESSLASALAAANDRDPKKMRRQRCEANFYGGELALLRGDRDAAARLLRAASGTCPRSSPEWGAGRAELKALGRSP
ncbi:MAG: hypothetical protein QOI12_2823 [Alphaproteobacteria bacterium]|nr:hypothetical protein [Alphaproteobacteria bacterium]